MKSCLRWLSLVLLFNPVLLDRLKCTENTGCDCYSSFLETDYECPRQAHIKIVADRYVSMDCEQNITINSIHELFSNRTSIETSNINDLQVNFCPQFAESYNLLAKKFNIQKLKALSIECLQGSEGHFSKAQFAELDSLEVLKIHYCSYTFDKDFLENLPNLKALYLDRNTVRQIDGMFNSTVNLTMLDLSLNQISALPLREFLNVKKLKILQLFQNNLTEVNKESFLGLTNLRSLELMNNKISQLPKDVFSELINLKNLSIRSNNLSKLHNDIFKNNTLLENIQLNRNKHLSLPDRIFSNLSKLKIVNLDECFMTDLPDHLFDNCVSLEEIRMRSNRIKNIPEKTFSGLTSLKKLYLDNNFIEDLPDYIFSSLNSLEELYLNNNNLKIINNNIFNKLYNLKILNINNNKIATIDNYAFKFLGNLQKVLVANNLLEMPDKIGLDPFQVGNTTKLMEIDLSGNNIGDNFIPGFFLTMHKLKSINLANNNITKITVTSFMPYYNLRVNLTYNKIGTVDFTDAESLAKVNTLNIGNYNNILSYSEPGAALDLRFNPIECDCKNYDLIRYNKDLLTPELKTFVDIKLDGIQCSDSVYFTDLKPSDAICEVSKELGCPNTCSCGWRRYDRTIVLDCSHKNLFEYPEIQLDDVTIRRMYEYDQLAVDLKGNYLLEGPLPNYKGYENVTILDIAQNNITNITWIPSHIKALNLSGNLLNRLEEGFINMLQSNPDLQTLVLNNNPWRCDCAMVPLRSFLRENVGKFSPFDVNVICNESGDLLVNTDELCPSYMVTILAISVILLLMFTALGVIYYFYEMEIKIWLYAKNLCLWFVQEEDLDKDKIYDVFISFSHKDEDFVTEQLLPTLERDSYKTCVHYRDFLPGEYITVNVNNSVQQSRRTLVVLSNNFLESVWGKMEFRTAHTEALKEGKARVIVVILGELNESALDDDLKAYLNTRTYVKWGDPWFWNKLKYALPHKKKLHHSQRHANMMLKIDNKFALPTKNGTAPTLTLDPALLKNHPLNPSTIVEVPLLKASPQSQLVIEVKNQ